MYWTEFNGVCYGYDSVNVYFGSIQAATITTNLADSLWCGPSYPHLSAIQPHYGYGYWMDTVPNTTFTPSPQTNNNLVATIDTGGTSYYGPHHFYWITVDGACRDTSSMLYVRYIEKPVANAGGHYWPGLFGSNHAIKTDTICGLNYQMEASPSVGIGTWFSLDITNVYFPNGFGNFTSTHVYNDSLYLHCNGCYTVFSTNTPYREFIWQEYNDICFDSDTLRLYFAPRPSGHDSILMPPCRHDSATIIANTWLLPNNVDYGITDFAWTYPGGNLNPAITNPNTSDTIYVSWPTGEHHTVTLITTNRWGCHSGIVTSTVVEPAPFAPIDTITDATCGNCNGKINLYTNYVDPHHVSHTNYYTFNWIDTVSTALVRDSLCHGWYYVRVNGQSLTPTAAPGTICHDTLAIMVHDTGFVVAQFDTMSIEQHQAAPYTMYLINTSINGKKYSWRVYDENGKLITTSTQTDFNYIFPGEGCYTIVLIATSKQLCRDTMLYKYVCVDSPPVFEIPNVFTPNGDGQNDEFIIHGKSITEFKCIIYNRWGRKLYEWDDVTKGWNGKINGNGAEASPGIYYFIVTAKDKKETDYKQTGFFYLLKEKK
jgi:gliding motility-associated-like protein